jgi:hypothetical protein
MIQVYRYWVLLATQWLHNYLQMPMLYTVRVKILTSDSKVIIYRSLLHATTSDDGNFCACMSGRESPINNGILNDRSFTCWHFQYYWHV